MKKDEKTASADQSAKPGSKKIGDYKASDDAKGGGTDVAESVKTGKPREDKTGVATRTGTDPDKQSKPGKVKGLKLGTIVQYNPSSEDTAATAPGGNPTAPLPAMVTKVWDEHTADLTVFRDGPPLTRQGVISKGEFDAREKKRKAGETVATPTDRGTFSVDFD